MNYMVSLTYTLTQPDIKTSKEMIDASLSFIDNISLIDINDAAPYFSIHNPASNYIKQLEYFKTHYDGFEKAFIKKYNHDDFDGCLIDLYNLINQSGIVGARNINILTQTILTRFKTHNFNPQTVVLVNSLMHLIEVLHSDLDRYLPKKEVSHIWVTRGKKDLILLRAMLEECDYNVYNFFENIEIQTFYVFNDIKVEKLKKSIFRYDFDEALKLIDDIL